MSLSWAGRDGLDRKHGAVLQSTILFILSCGLIVHIPDGFLSLPVLLGCGALSLGGLGMAIHSSSRGISDRQVPLMGVTGAFVFAAQMVNFPVAAGTSGHLIGAALLTAVLGPHISAVVMTCVLVVQCLLFQDGGLSALGANVLNMALAASYASAALSWLGRRLLPGHRYAVIFAASWVSVMAGAVLTSLELSISGTVGFIPVLLAMGTVHAIIGLGEGLLTVGILRFLLRIRPDLLTPAETPGASRREVP